MPHVRCGIFLVIVVTIAAAPLYAENPNWPDGIADDADLSLPANMPDDPGYYHERYEAEALVDVGGQWNLWSFVPQLWIDVGGEPIRAEEITLGTGMHADRAWLLSIGRRDVIIAVLDSGAYWDNQDLRYKYYLNPGELDRDGARPCVAEDFAGDPLDVNADGLFNIADYEAFSGQCDFDIDADGNGNGMIDPQDFFDNARYSDGVDDDGNGYIDDISGWDFFWNDNDAYDDTRYGHGNGEAEDSGAQANNGIGDAGVFPECAILMVRVGDSQTDGNDLPTPVAVDLAPRWQEALGTVSSPTSPARSEYAYDNNVVVIAGAADELSFHHNLPAPTTTRFTFTRWCTTSPTFPVHHVSITTTNTTGSWCVDAWRWLQLGGHWQECRPRRSHLLLCATWPWTRPFRPKRCAAS
jgi:hypothetical protein